MSARQTGARFFQSAHAVWMYFDTSGIQAYYGYLDLYDSQLLQVQKRLLQHTFFGPAVYPDIDHMPIPVFFGQPPPLAPILYDVQHGIQCFQVTNFRWLPLLGKTFLNFFIRFSIPFHTLKEPLISSTRTS